MRIIIRENYDKYLYHNSPDPNIELFVPRAVWRNEDWSESDNKENIDFLREDVIFAIDKDKVIFYSLPRDTPRIFILDSKTFLLPKKEKQKVEKHSWTQYIFLKKDFQEVPTGEWVSRKALKPIAKKQFTNPIKMLLDSGYKINWVADLHKSADELRQKNIIFDSENL